MPTYPLPLLLAEGQLHRLLLLHFAQLLLHAAQGGLGTDGLQELGQDQLLPSTYGKSPHTSTRTPHNHAEQHYELRRCLLRAEMPSAQTTSTAPPRGSPPSSLENPSTSWGGEKNVGKAPRPRGALTFGADVELGHLHAGLRALSQLLPAGKVNKTKEKR